MSGGSAQERSAGAASLAIGRLVEVAALVGDATRAEMLLALMDRGPMPAGELARIAGVSASTGSEHLGRLLAAGLVQVRKEGRHRRYSLGSPAIHAMLRQIQDFAGRGTCL